MTVEVVTTETIKCSNCGSTAVVRFGKYKGVQRYFCKSCRRKFKADDTLFHGKVPAEYSSSAVDMYYRGMSIHDISDHLKQEYGYAPSKGIISKWVNKYTDLASKQFRDIHPKVGDTWIADETMLDVDGGHKIWFYDIIDRDTRFLLASRVALSRTTHDAQLLMEAAKKRAGKSPKEVLTDGNFSYIDGIEKAYGGDTEHVLGNPFKLKETGESTSEIERFHGTLKDRTKVFRAFRDVETLIQFTDGWLVYYNYFKTHESLGDKTPAQEAHVKYDVKDWADLARVPVPKQVRVISHGLQKARTPKTHVSLAKAFKRHRRSSKSQISPEIGGVR